MRHLGLLARMAFICNLFFLLCLVLQRGAPASENMLVSMFAVLGIVLGMCFLNPVSNLLTGLALLQRRPIAQKVPGWLALSNLVFLMCQILYIVHTLS